MVPYLVDHNSILRVSHREQVCDECVKMLESYSQIRTLSKFDAVGYLLDILKKRGSHAFPTFYDALLETGQHDLAVLLECQLPVGYARSSTNAPQSGVASTPAHG